MKHLLALILLCSMFSSVAHASVSTSSSMNRDYNCFKSKRDDTMSLVCSMYFEANAEGKEGAILTGLVVKNRANDSSGEFKNIDTYSDAVWQKGKTGVPYFSWTQRERAIIPKEKLGEYLFVSLLIDIGYYDDLLPEDVKWYHRKGLQRKWTKRLFVVKRHKNHVFFSSKRPRPKKEDELTIGETASILHAVVNPIGHIVSVLPNKD